MEYGMIVKSGHPRKILATPESHFSFCIFTLNAECDFKIVHFDLSTVSIPHS